MVKHLIENVDFGLEYLVHVDNWIQTDAEQ